MALPPIFIEFLGDYTGLKETADGVKTELAEVDAEGGGSLESLGAVSTGVLLGMGAAFVGVGYESAKLAISFQSAMESIHTQAGVPQAALQGLSSGVLQLAGQVGFSPDSLAEALYHIESSFESVGISGASALNVLKIAAEGAAVGHANLVDVTNALDAAIASGIPGVQNYSQAMGALNAIVGTGDMTMQDLADAMGTGMLAVVKGYGLSLNDVGAALAVFGDNNIRGANAATDLRMAVQAMQTPVSTAGPVMKQLGINSQTLADTMQKGGLLPALTLLKTKMDAAGLGGVKMSQTLTDLVGKKAGTGLDVLISQLDRVSSKYPKLESGANSFGSDVAANNSTMAQKINEIKAAFESLGVTLGQKLLPVVASTLGYMATAISWLAAHQTVFTALGVGLGALTVALVAVKIATIEWSATLLANPAVWIAAAIIALGAAIYYAYEKSATFREIVQDVGRVLQAAFGVAVRAAGAVLDWFRNGPLKNIESAINYFKAFWQSHGQEIEEIAKVVWVAISTEIKIAIAVITAMVKPWIALIQMEVKFGFDFVKNYIKMVWDFVKNVFTTAFKVLMDSLGIFLDLITGKWSKLGADTKKLWTDLVNGIVKIVSDLGKDALHLLYQAGKDIVQGLINGVKSMFGAVGGMVKDIGSAITGGFHSVMGILSPSRVMYKSGTYVIQGLLNSLKDGKSLLSSEAGNLGKSIMSGFGAPKLGIGGIGMGTSVGGNMLGANGLNSSGATVIQNTVNINNQGNVLAENDLRDQVQQAMLRLGGRNISTWAPARV